MQVLEGKTVAMTGGGGALGSGDCCSVMDLPP